MLTGMELKAVGVVLLVVVAVDALPFCRLCTEHVIVDDTLVVVLNATLTDGQVFVDDIRRRNQAVANIGIDGVGRYVDIERLETRPLVVGLNINLHLNSLALGILGQSLPVVCIGLYFRSATH